MTTIVYARIDKTYIDSDLTNFPVGIKLTASHNILSGLGSTDYEGFHFTANGVECYAEVDVWDMTGEEAIIWVNVPNVYSDNDTIIKIENVGDDNTSYVGITGSTPAQNVWDSDFVAVYHLSQDPSASDILDSTSNGYDLTPNGSMTSGDLVDCNFGKGIEFDGSNDVLKRNSITFSPSLSFPITLESYGKSRSTSFGSTYSNPYVTLTDASESDQFLTLALYNNATRTYKYNSSIIIVNGVTAVGTSEEITLAARFVSNTSLRLYLNGAYENEGTTSLALPSGIDSISIGGPIDNTPAYYQGIACDYRISNTDRSEAWIKATYHVFNQDLITILAPINDYLEVTIDSSLIDSDLTNFPVGIKIDSSDSILSGLGSTDYEGFHFFSNGVECYAEIDIWDMTSEIAVVWVNVPSVLSASDSVVEIHNFEDNNTSNVDVTGNGAAQLVWDTNFIAVYHMSQEPSGGTGAMLDSSSNGNDANGVGWNGTLDKIDGDFGNALNFNGSGEYLVIPTSSSLDAIQNATLEAYINFDTIPVPAAGDAPIFSMYYSATDRLQIKALENDEIRLFNDIDNVGSGLTSSTSLLSEGTSYHVATTIDSSDWISYVDTVEALDLTSGKDISDLNNGYVINIGYLPATSAYLDGKISEIFISDIIRSDAWLKATYHVLSNDLLTKELIEIGGEVPVSGNIYGQISINEKNVNIIGVFLVEKGKWRTVEEIYILNDGDWRQNIIS